MKKPISARSRHASTIAGAVAALFAASVPTPSCANPTGAQVVSGAVSVNSPAAGQMNITQGTPNAIVNWNTFSIGAKESVTIAQPSATATLLNRVLGNDESVIAGHLQANGRVFLVNPAGVIFAPGSSVNVGSMIASTLDISDADFLAGHFRFVGASAAPVANAGTLTAQDGGTIALLGGTVSNTGIVSARLGTVALGAGSDVTVDFAGDGLTTLQIDQGAAHALVGNAGTLAADGGTVVMSAQTADALAGTVLNQQGIVRARSVAERDGHIFLDGGSNGITQVSGTLDATGGAGLTGGRIDVTGHDVALLAGADVDASGAAGGGTVRFGGGAAGADPTIRDAEALWMAPDATIRADALVSGNGGHIVAYADTVARLYGTLSAQGGPQQGAGGLIETSAQTLDMTGATVIASAPHGPSGTWLLDPYEIDITSGASTVTPGTPGGTMTFSYTGPTETTLTNGTIEAELNNGTSVTVATSASGDAGAGDIDVYSSIQKTAGTDAMLSLQASGSIVIGYGVTISSTVGKLNLLFDANVGGLSPGSNVSIGGEYGTTSISTNGGNFVVNGNGGSGGVSLVQTSVDTGGGNVQITGNVAPGGMPVLDSAETYALIGGIVLDGATISTHGGNAQFIADVNAPAATIAYYTAGTITVAGVVANQSTISTQGGNVTIGGTVDSTIPVTAIGTTPSITSGGVVASQLVVDAQGGNVQITGNDGSGQFGVALTNQSTIASNAAGGLSIDGTETGGSGIGVDVTGSTLSTASGTIELTGNANLSVGTAEGANGTGINIDSSTLSAGSGAIKLTGTVNLPSGEPSSGGDGIDVGNTSTLSTGGGPIDLTGTVNLPSSALYGASGTGINIDDATLSAGGNGAIGLTGTVSQPAGAQDNGSGTGVSIYGSGLSTASGAIGVMGTVNLSPDGQYGYGTGVSLDSSGVTTGSGAITMTGIVSAPGSGTPGFYLSGIGIDLNDGAQIASSSGAITLTGTTAAAATSNTSLTGVVLEGETEGPSVPSSVTTGSGTLRVYGNGIGQNVEGVLVTDGSTIQSTGGGDIDIRGAVVGPAASTAGASNPQGDYGVMIPNGSVTVTGASGNLSIAGSTNTSDPGIALGYVGATASSDSEDSYSFLYGPVTISTANPGTIALLASNDGTASSLVSRSYGDGQLTTISSPGQLAIAPASVDPSTFTITSLDATPITLLNAGPGLSIDPITFATFSNFQTMIFGSSTQTGLITVYGQCASSPCTTPTRPDFSTNLTLSNPGAGSAGIVLPYGISLPGHTLALASAGPVTDPGGIQAAGLLLAGPGSFTLTDPQNDVGVLAMANAGNVNFLNSVGFAIGPIVGKTYDATSGQVTTIDATNSTLTGNLVATAATGGISLGGGTPAPNGPTGGPNTNLTAGGSADLVMENGVFTDAGTGTISAGNAWRIWALTWNGETRGNVQPNTTQPNFYGCLFGAGCSWGGTVPATGNHYVYADRPTLTVTAGDATRPALTSNPPFTYTVSGLINGDAAATLTGGVTTPATQTSPIGTYPIDPNFASSVGYVVNQVPGTLTVLPLPDSQLPLALSGLLAFFGSSEQTFVYENNLQGTNICIGSTQPLFTTAPPGEQQDLLAVEWKRVRQQPNLNSCLITNGEHGCGDF
jgi:filamentous hemagglutinin family protein